MPTVKSDGETAAHFVFNQIITLFVILRELVTDHGRNFHNKMMEEFSSKLTKTRVNPDYQGRSSVSGGVLYFPNINP